MVYIELDLSPAPTACDPAETSPQLKMAIAKAAEVVVEVLKGLQKGQSKSVAVS